MWRYNKHTFSLRSVRLPIISMLVVLLLSSCLGLKPTTVEVTSYRMQSDGTYQNDPALEAIIQPYREQFLAKTSIVIGQSMVELTKGKPESTLGNFFTDIMWEEGQKIWPEKIDFAIQNYGGLRRPFLPKGDITVGDIIELMPFENYMTKIEGDSAMIQQVFDKIALYGGWPVSRQVHFEIQGKKAGNITINGETLTSDRKYVFILPDYIANGGDRFTFLKKHPRDMSEVLIREAIIQNLKTKYKKGTKISASIDGRISVQEE